MEYFLLDWMCTGDMDDKCKRYEAYKKWRKIFRARIEGDMSGWVGEDWDYSKDCLTLILKRNGFKTRGWDITREMFDLVKDPFLLIAETWVRCIQYVNKEEGNRTIYDSVYEAKLKQLDGK